MDKVQLHSDPEFNSAVPAGKKGEFKMKKVCPLLERSLPTFSFDSVPSPHKEKKKKPFTISKQRLRL